MMTSWYPQPNITNYTGLFEYADSVTEGAFTLAIPFMIFIIVFVGTPNSFTPNKKFLVSGLFSGIISVLLRVLGWCDDWVVVLFAMIILASLIMEGINRWGE